MRRNAPPACTVRGFPMNPTGASSVAKNATWSIGTIVGIMEVEENSMKWPLRAGGSRSRPPSASIGYMPGIAPHALFLSPTGSPCGDGVPMLCLPSLPLNPHPPPTPAHPGGNQRYQANEGGHGACNHSAAARSLNMPFSCIIAIWLSGLQPYRGELSSGQSIGLISQRGSARFAPL